MEITEKEFLIRQPQFPNSSETDPYYLEVARTLVSDMRKTDPESRFSDGLLMQVALNITGYFQDIISDAGIWRSFITACRELYGFTVPFYPVSEDYVDYELNLEDIKFLVWYSIAMLSESNRLIFPLDSSLTAISEKAYAYLESIYDDAPTPEGFNIAFNLEFNDPEDSPAIYKLGNWLFTHCYLITPAFAADFSDLLDMPEAQGKDGHLFVNKQLEEAILERPTGPLAMFIPEWVYLILKGKMPKEKDDTGKEPHPYYDAFLKATGGKEYAFFATYEEMNRFFIEGLGWEAGKRHLNMAEHDHDFVLLVNKNRGMLMARNVAKCFKTEGNPLYNEDFAKENAIKCLTQRGYCPADLVKYAFRHGWLPDAAFPSDTRNLSSECVQNAWDFIARCYLQGYYRD